jgi:hypothetical protein
MYLLFRDENDNTCNTFMIIMVKVVSDCY